MQVMFLSTNIFSLYKNKEDKKNGILSLLNQICIAQNNHRNNKQIFL